jgi:hypothetical protein
MGAEEFTIVGDDTKLAGGRQPLESREAYKAAVKISEEWDEA